MLKKGDIITIAGGHSGHTGARGCGYKEEDLAKEVAVKLTEMFNANGYKAYNCSPTGTGYTVNSQLQAEVNNANRYNAKLHLCIHFNAFNSNSNGTETWICGRGGNAEKFAIEINKSLVGLGFANRGVRVAGVDGKKLFVPSYTKAPCCLIETCFIDSKKDMDRYNLDNTCKAIYKAVTGESYSSNVNTPVENKGANTGVYRVICGSFKVKAYALNKEKELNNKGFNTCLWYTSGLYKVQVGAFATKENAENLRKKLIQSGFDSYIEFK